jgi:Terpene synthase family 2, C-terminal metal binding
MIGDNAEVLTIPELHCPFPHALHPQAEEIEERMLAWARQHGFASSEAHTERIRRTRWGFLVSHCLPDGDVERVLLAAKLYCLGSKYDHEKAERPAAEGRLTETAGNLLRLQTIVSAPHGELPAGADAWDRAWQDWGQSLHKIATPYQLSRFQTGLAEYCMANACEATFTAGHEPPSFEEYLTIRRFTGAMRLSYFQPIEWVGGFALTPEQWHQPDFVALTTCAQNVFAYTNDILSCQREVADWAVAMNLPAALARHHGYSLQQGIDAAAAMHRQETETFIHLAKQLRPQADRGVCAYLDGLPSFLVGHLDWYQETGRYTCGPA